MRSYTEYDIDAGPPHLLRRDTTINETTEGTLNAPPKHYATSIQPIELIDAGQDAGMIGYYEGQIIKYVFRWRKRNGLRDLKAAAWFLNRMIAREETKVHGNIPISESQDITSSHEGEKK